MTPAFALSFTSESITLQQRAAGGGWQDIGHTLFEAPDLDRALEDLRKQALVCGAGDLGCVLILPQDLIRHLTIQTGVRPRAERLALAAKALDGATPYAVADLAFDISEDGPRTHIAAVAHETLTEAEGFARSHGFVPLRFAGPKDGTPFSTPPFFGDCAPAPGQTDAPAALPAVPPAPPAAPAEPPEAGADQPPAPIAQAAPPQGDTGTKDADPKETAEPSSAATPEAPAAAAPEPKPAPAAPSAPKAAPAAPARPSRQSPAAAASLAGSGPNAPAPTTPAQTRRTEAKTPPAKPALAADRQAPAAPAVNSAKLLQTASARPVTEMPPPQESAASLSYTQQAGGLAWSRFDAMRHNPRRLAMATSAMLLAAGTVAGLAFLALSDPNDSGRSRAGEPETAESVLETSTAEPPIAPQVSVLADQPDPGLRETGLSENGLSDTGASEAGLSEIGLDETGEVAAIEDPAIEADAPADTGLPLGEAASGGTLVAEPDAPATAETAAQLELSRAAQYAATGIWQSPPGITDPPRPAGPQTGTDGIYVAAIDNGELAQDAVALPPSESYATDTPPEPLASPAAPGATFDLDARGLVKPTAEGTLNPDGVTIYLGRPAKVPPDAPARPDPAAEAAAEAAARDRILSQKRPRPRPENFAEAAERAQLGGLSRAERAALRPRPRPASLKPANEAELPSTAQAVRSAKTPRPRPANFANLVDRARRNATNTPAAAVPAAAAAPAPRIPTRASVARSATVDRALNLRKLNLIGVYGSASDRRALIRLPSGRYKKVKVGDRVDGGRVIAIGEGQLQYQKRGKNRTLKMPNG